MLPGPFTTEVPDGVPESTKLVFNRDRETVNETSDTDELPASVVTDTDEMWEFRKARDARVMLGLWAECGPFTTPQDGAMPVEVACHSAAARAAWLYCRPADNDQRRTREEVADVMGLEQKHSVSNYLGEIRWSLLDNLDSQTLRLF